MKTNITSISDHPDFSKLAGPSRSQDPHITPEVERQVNQALGAHGDPVKAIIEAFLAGKKASIPPEDLGLALRALRNRAA